MEKLELQKIANEVRKDIVTALHSAKAGHPGGSLSAADVFTYLYFEEMNIDPKDPKKADRDRFVLSKGHTAPGYYSALAERGFFPKEDLKTLRHLGSYLQGHPDMKHIPGVDMSSGSLGQGISAAVGMALSAKLSNESYRVYTLLGDGEIQEGQVWEAAMFAGLKKSSGDYVVIMDADLQHPPVLLKEMYKAVSEEGYDCCAGKRVDRTGEGKIRNFLSHAFYKVMQKMCKMDMSDGCGDFRMMSRQMVDAILELKEYNRYMKGLFSFVGFDTKWIEFHNVQRVAGNSKWNFSKLFAYAMEGMFSFSTAPIVWIGNIGTAIMI